MKQNFLSQTCSSDEVSDVSVIYFVQPGHFLTIGDKSRYSYAMYTNYVTCIIKVRMTMQNLFIFVCDLADCINDVVLGKRQLCSILTRNIQQGFCNYFPTMIQGACDTKLFLKHKPKQH